MSLNDSKKPALVSPCLYCDSENDTNVEIAVRKLTDFLPDGYEHYFCSAEADGLVAVLRVNVATVDEVHSWQKALQYKTKMTFRIERGSAVVAKRVLLKQDFRCMHRTLPRSETADWRMSSMNTCCPAGMRARLQKSTFQKTMASNESDEILKPGTKRISQSKDLHIPDFPFRVSINLNHNHPLDSSEFLRHRDVGPEAELRITELLEDLHSPSAALEILKLELQEKYGEEYETYAEDRHYCPDIQWCYRLYHKLFKRSYNDDSTLTEEMLQEKIQQFNNAMEQQVGALEQSEINPRVENENFIAMAVVDGEHLAVAICTPLMKRVHRLVKHTGELVFIDTCGYAPRKKSTTRVTMLRTHSAAGGLPVGVLVCSNDNESTVTAALHLYNTLMDSTCYAGRGPEGPLMFVTDDHQAERASLKFVYPQASLLMGSFHILRAFWRSLWDAKSGINKDDRQNLFYMLTTFVYSESDESLKQAYMSIVDNELLKRYPKLTSYFQSLFDRREEWSLSSRTENSPCVTNMSNLCEVAMRVLKDGVLHRAKGFNILQIIDFIVSRLEPHYQRRLTDLASDKLDFVRNSRYVPYAGSINSIEQLNEHQFIVLSEHKPGISYMVDMFLGLCTCEQGKNGAPCKHQSVVMETFKVQMWNFLPITQPSLRRLFYSIATGEKNRNDDDDNDDDENDMNNDKIERIKDEDAVTYTLPEVPTKTVLERFDAAVTKLKSVFKDNPMLLKSAMISFCNQTEQMTTVSSVQTALFQFGKSSNVPSQSQ